MQKNKEVLNIVNNALVLSRFIWVVYFCSVNTNIMKEFWEVNFIEKQTSWGFEPSDSAILSKDFFLENDVKNILIPGIGYGRNAKIFTENGINVTGIEISKTAIDLAKNKNP